MHLQRQLGCPGLKQMDRWQQSDWIFSLPRIIFPILAYGSTITLDVGREYCLYHTLSLALHPSSLPLPWLPHQLPSPTSIPCGISFFFFALSLYHVVTWISSFSGYLDRALLWSPDWLQTQNNSPASFFWVLGFQAYTTYSGPDSSLNSLFRSRWITWEEKLFHLFLPIVQSILSNEHISIGHVARYLT